MNGSIRHVAIGMIAGDTSHGFFGGDCDGMPIGAAEARALEEWLVTRPTPDAEGGAPPPAARTRASKRMPATRRQRR